LNTEATFVFVVVKIESNTMYYDDIAEIK